MSMSTKTNQQPLLPTVSMSLFPTFNSLQEVVDLATARLPLTSKNDISIILYIYHNTLLSLQAQH